MAKLVLNNMIQIVRNFKHVSEAYLGIEIAGANKKI